MEPLWYYRLFDTEFGPIDTPTLMDLHECGTLSDTDEVRAADSPQWIAYQKAMSPAVESSRATAVAAPSNHSPDDELSWYYQTLGQELGPVSFNELRQLAEQGSLSADDEIKFGIDGKYRRVGSLGKLAACLPYASVPEKVVKKSDPVVAQVTAESSVAVREEPAAPVTIQYHPAATEASWYAFIRGVEYGPSSLVQLSQFLQAGQIAATDFVKYGAYGSWMPPSPTIEQTLSQYIIQTPAPVAVKAPAIPATATPPAKPATAAPPVENKTPAPANKTAVAPVTVQPAAAVAPKTEAAAVIPVAKPVEETRPEPVVLTPAAAMSSSTGAWSPPASPARAPAKAPARQKSGGGVSLDLSALTSDPKTLGAVGFVAAVGLIFAFLFLLPASTAGERAKLEQLQKIYTTFKYLRENNANSGDWEQFTSETMAAVKPMVDELQGTASRQYPARQSLLWAARDRLDDMLQTAREKPSPAEEEFDYNLKKAANYLGLGPDPDLERATAALAVPNDG
ncbi:hypothetical protein GC163_07080 [bacterium]|nr:hypothetical protein [bacterium]